MRIQPFILIIGIVGLVLGSSQNLGATTGENIYLPFVHGGGSAVVNTIPRPLSDPGPWNYQGFTSGLYPDGQHTPPTAHLERGLAAAAQIQPRNVAGQPDPNGRYVLMSVGMSNTSQEFCNAAPSAPLTCRGESPFIPQARADAQVNQQSLVLVNGARGLHSVDYWESPSAAIYDSIRASILQPQGLSEAQVQIIWLKHANARSPTRPPLPDPNADAYVLMRALGNAVRALAVRYPNLQQVYLSSRSYGGYATGYTNSPEPYAYETGFAVKWLIAAQIRQLATGEIDPIAGDLSLEVAPWLAWGPYLWADGATPRADGLVWLRSDFVDDGIHPSPSGQSKVGSMLLNFFKTSPTSACWFLRDQHCP